MAKQPPKKDEVQFNKPPQQVLQERQLTPDQEAQRARVAQLKGQRQPLGGAPPVNIPPLDASPIKGGGTMQDQAEVLRDPASPLSPSYNPALAGMPMTPDQAAQQNPHAPRMAPGGQVQAGQQNPFAGLPPSAAQQPGFRPGIGSMISGNQPALDGYKPNISDKTKESMQSLAAFQQQAQQQQETGAARADVAAGTTDAEEMPSLQDELREIGITDYQWNALNNPERRKIIEDRLDPLDITDIILHGEVRQDVPIHLEKLTVQYRSVTGEEDLAVKRMMYTEEGGDRYMMDKYTLMQLALALVSINGQPLPAHLDNEQRFDEKMFVIKFEKVLRFPVQFLADLGIQYLWFDERVRHLFVGATEALKNT